MRQFTEVFFFFLHVLFVKVVSGPEFDSRLRCLRLRSTGKLDYPAADDRTLFLRPPGICSHFLCLFRHRSTGTSDFSGRRLHAHCRIRCLCLFRLWIRAHRHSRRPSNDVTHFATCGPRILSRTWLSLFVGPVHRYTAGGPVIRAGVGADARDLCRGVWQPRISCTTGARPWTDKACPKLSEPPPQLMVVWVHLFVVYGYQGSEEDREKLSLTDKLLHAVLAEAQVCCV